MPRGFTIFLLSFVGIVALVWGTLLYTQNDRLIKTDIVINAPPDKIWRVLTNTNEYSSWNPAYPSITGNLEVDDKIHVTIRTGSGSTFTYPARNRVVIIQQEWTWLGGIPVPRLLRIEHTFHLEARVDGSSRFRNEEHIFGLCAGLFTSNWMDGVEQSLTAMNKALKTRSEQAP